MLLWLIKCKCKWKIEKYNIFFFTSSYFYNIYTNNMLVFVSHVAFWEIVDAIAPEGTGPPSHITQRLIKTQELVGFELHRRSADGLIRALNCVERESSITAIDDGPLFFCVKTKHKEINWFGTWSKRIFVNDIEYGYKEKYI